MKTSETVKFDFTKIKLTDINGIEIKNHDFHKAIANTIYNAATNLDLVEKAMEINKGKEVELKESEKNEILEIIKNSQGILAFAKKSAIEFLS